MVTEFDKGTAMPWFSASFGELHMTDMIDVCVHWCNTIPCFDIDIRAAAAKWR